jgi:hypothetical protein
VVRRAGRVWWRGPLVRRYAPMGPRNVGERSSRRMARVMARTSDIEKAAGVLSIFSVPTYQVTAPAPLASSTCRGGSQLKASVMQSTRQSSAS